MLAKPNEVERILKTLPGWEGDTVAIRRIVSYPSFRQLIAAVNNLAELAEKRQHHPDLDIRYTTLHVQLTTHDAGGVTHKDLEMAAEVDRFLPPL
jgi:4a-hydroxytetrahydrobiopterin dehydratase